MQSEIFFQEFLSTLPEMIEGVTLLPVEIKASSNNNVDIQQHAIFYTQVNDHYYCIAVNFAFLVSCADAMMGGDGRIDTFAQNADELCDAINGFNEIMNMSTGYVMARSLAEPSSLSISNATTYTISTEILTSDIVCFSTSELRPQTYMQYINNTLGIASPTKLSAEDENDSYEQSPYYNNPENDILTPEYIDTLLDPYEVIYEIEDRPHLISRMLLYIMLAQEKGLLGLLDAIKWGNDPLTHTLLESAIDGKESAELMEMAKEEIALLEFKEGDKPLYQKNINIILTTIKLLHEGKGLKEAAAQLENI